MQFIIIVAVFARGIHSALLAKGKANRKNIKQIHAQIALSVKLLRRARLVQKTDAALLVVIVMHQRSAVVIVVFRVMEKMNTVHSLQV